MNTEDIDELKSHAICADCIGERYLSALVEAEGEELECSYCENVGQAITLEDMAGRIETAFEDHFTRTSSEPNAWQYAMLKDKEIDYDWDRDGEPTVYAIMNAADIPEDAAGDIQSILEYQHYDFDEAAMGEEGAFSSEANYEEIMPGDEEWQEGWRSFERTVKSEARFFSRAAAAQLSLLFDDIGSMRTREGEPLIIDAGPDTEITDLYRARVFQSQQPLEAAMRRPDLEMAAPPSRLARAGRMNARGISVFYGATQPDIATAEVRPPVGSRVAVAQFEILRPIRLLNLAALGNVQEAGSMFDPTYANRLGRMTFLRTLSHRMARPVMPDDEEFEYLPTQAIADYLATEGQEPIDGILFPSVQVNGNGDNIVLFHKASRCEELELPEGTELSADTYHHTEDGPEPDYVVIERVPPEVEQDEAEPTGVNFAAMVPYLWEDPGDFDPRDITLRVDPESMRVHEVDAVSFSTNEHAVRRYRWTKTDEPY